jgi:hypothetical protein
MGSRVIFSGPLYYIYIRMGTDVTFHSIFNNRLIQHVYNNLPVSTKQYS